MCRRQFEPTIAIDQGLTKEAKGFMFQVRLEPSLSARELTYFPVEMLGVDSVWALRVNEVLPYQP